jgi:hypothetical protein
MTFPILGVFLLTLGTSLLALYVIDKVFLIFKLKRFEKELKKEFDKELKRINAVLLDKK